jgi:hypothetical protein
MRRACGLLRPAGVNEPSSLERAIRRIDDVLQTSERLRAHIEQQLRYPPIWPERGRQELDSRHGATDGDGVLPIE